MGYKEIKTTLGVLKDDQETIKATGKNILNGARGKTKKQIDDEVFILSKRIKIIDDALASLPELQRRIIERRIIDGEPYFIVCAELHMGERGARKLKRKALQVLERIMQMT
jgi:DNA-directed RNA polymerase specialized sigma24 family protein